MLRCHQLLHVTFKNTHKIHVGSLFYILYMESFDLRKVALNFIFIKEINTVEFESIEFMFNSSILQRNFIYLFIYYLGLSALIDHYGNGNRQTNSNS